MITALIKGFDRMGGATYWIVYQEDMGSGILRNHKAFLSHAEGHRFFMTLVKAGG